MASMRAGSAPDELDCPAPDTATRLAIPQASTSREATADLIGGSFAVILGGFAQARSG
jgi:hypothetical protein